MPKNAAPGIHRVENVRFLSSSVFVIRFERLGLLFRPGQHLILGLPGATDRREYSIYSADRDEFLEVLVKTVDGGLVSPQLMGLRPGDSLTVDGPFGDFVIDEVNAPRRLRLIATGTGIAPYHSFVRSYPGLDYEILHGVRYRSECYDSEDYSRERYQPCVSGEIDAVGNRTYGGRVTSWLLENGIDSEGLHYLCGNSDMVYEVYGMLRDQGVAESSIATEVYF